LQRYQNVKKELENQQNLERIKVEKAFTRPGRYLLAARVTIGTATMSRSQTMNQSKMSYQSSSKLKGAAPGKNYPASKPSHH